MAKHFGEVEGVPEGTLFASRSDVSAAGIHAPFIAGRYGVQAGNAVQHAYWMARVARIEGRDWALGLGEAHERDGGDGPADTAKDLFNNNVGARIGVRARREAWSDRRLRSEIESALGVGDLRVLGTRGSIRPSSCRIPK